MARNIDVLLDLVSIVDADDLVLINHTITHNTALAAYHNWLLENKNQFCFNVDIFIIYDSVRVLCGVLHNRTGFRHFPIQDNNLDAIWGPPRYKDVVLPV